MGIKPRLTAEMISAEMIERFRRTGIRLDRHGRFWHEGAEITHAGFRRALLQWLDRLEDGRYILRLDATRYAYLEVDDAPMLVTSARWQDDRVRIVINDGSEEELDYATLTIAADNALYCLVHGGRLEARLTPSAAHTVAEAVEEHDDGFVLCAAGQSFALGSRQA